MLNVNLSYAFFDPFDYVSDALVVVGYMIGLGIAAWAKETRERSFFLAIVELQRTHAAIKHQQQVMRVALEVALPAGLLRDGALTVHGVSHYSKHATVSVADIYSFSQWTTWHLVADVIVLLDELINIYDEAVACHDGVERAMTYGDSYVICCALLEPHHRHAEAVLECALEQRLYAKRMSAGLERAEFHTRTSIFSGELRGASIGTTSRRYVITGPAFDAALDRMGLCDRDGLVIGSDLVHENETASTSGTVPHAQLAAGDEGIANLGARNAVSGEMPGSDPTSDADADEWRRFSPLWLTFPDARMHAYLAANNERSKHLAAADALALAVVVTAFVVIVAVEHASADERRHHINEPPAVAVLLAALCVAWGHTGALIAGVKLPVVTATALSVATAGLTGVALVLLQCYFAKAYGVFVLLFGFLNRFDVTVPWLVQVLLVFASAVAPAIASNVLRGSTAATIFIVVVVTPVLCVVHRYFTVRANCEYIVAAAMAAGHVLRSDAQLTKLDQLLDGLLPPHVLAVVGVSLVTGQIDDGDTNLQNWCGLSITQVQVYVGRCNIQPVWAAVSKALDLFGDLELVQSSGDKFLVAGPFLKGVGDAQLVAAARHTITALRALSAEMSALKCTFTAVATSGDASSALIGAGNLTYRLFGGAVRENDAIMAAAPKLVIGEPRNAAFASDSFRLQERNFAVVRHEMAEMAMSTAIELAVSEGYRSSPGLPSGSSATLPASTEQFGTTVTWRAVGLGAARVSIIKLLV
jgi:class 3 adenylate cyclase